MPAAAAMLRFRSLGSGSGGNATLVEARGADGALARVMVDCGFTLRELNARLAATGLVPQDLDALFITHEHGDHVGCALALAERHDLAIFMSRGTWRAIGPAAAPPRLAFARDGEALAVGDIELRPFTVAHDAAEPLQLRCTDGNVNLGVLTDLGSITAHMLEHVGGCDALVLECNHDAQMLAASRYPPSVRARIGGRFGHLENSLAVEIYRRAGGARLEHLVAAHLSRENNRPEVVRAAFAEARGSGDADLVVADPVTGFGWLQIG